MTWYANPQWWVVIIAPFLGVLGIFQNRIRSCFCKPELKISINVNPPDCHKVPLIDPKTQQYVGQSYYCRFRIENTGNYRMEDVEIMITDLYEKTSKNDYEKVESFLPLNLLWSHYHIVAMSRIQSHLYKHCDFGHIIKAELAKAFHYDLPKPCQVMFHLDTAVKPTTGTFLLLPGDYKVRIIVAGSNVKPQPKIYHLVVEDNWTDDEKIGLHKSHFLRSINHFWKFSVLKKVSESHLRN